MNDTSVAFATETEAIRQANDEATPGLIVLDSLISHLLPVDSRKEIVSTLSTKQRRALGHPENHVPGSLNALGKTVNGQIERRETISRRRVGVQASEQIQDDAAS